MSEDARIAQQERSYDTPAHAQSYDDFHVRPLGHVTFTLFLSVNVGFH